MLACPRARNLCGYNGLGNQRHEDDRALDFLFYDFVYDDCIDYFSFSWAEEAVWERQHLARVWADDSGSCGHSADHGGLVEARVARHGCVAREGVSWDEGE